MKTAVLVWGEFREFENAHKSWNFLKDLNYDIYFSTWDNTIEKNELLNIDINESVSEDRILKYFPNATINIETQFWSHSPSKVIHHWRKLFNMVQISNIEYDNVMLIRPDIVLDESHDKFEPILHKLNDERIIYGLGSIQSQKPPVYLFVGDCMFVGKLKLMREIFLSFPPPDITRRNIHYHLSKHFIENDIFVESIHGNIFKSYFIMRSIHRNYLNLPFTEQQKIAEGWFIAKYENRKTDFITNLLNEKTC